MRVRKVARGEYCNTTAEIEGLFIDSYDAEYLQNKVQKHIL
jgi:hypothetical protein